MQRTQELLFRCALLDWLCRSFALSGAIGQSASLFAALHAATHGGQVLKVMVLGALFGFKRCASGRLWPGLLLHAAVNGYAVSSLS